MRYQTIQGVPVPALGLGTYKLKGDACRTAVAHALELGYRHIDTAQMYGNEAAVGQGLRDASVDRDEVFLTTKLWRTNLHPADVRATAEESLRTLNTDYVDLLLIHWPNEAVPLAATLEAMRDLQTQDKVRHIGVSNFTPALVEDALSYAPLFANQVEYHPFLSQAPLLEMTQAHDLMLTAYQPIARGTVNENETLQSIGAAHGKTPVQVTLRWLVQQDQVVPIPKAARAEHRAANIDIFDFELTADEMAQIHALHRGERRVDPHFAPWA